jgi:hypothetical protein
MIFNADIWIGSSCDTFAKKFSAHKADASRNLENDCILHNFIREYGFDRFGIHSIELVEDFPREDLSFCIDMILV